MQARHFSLSQGEVHGASNEPPQQTLAFAPSFPSEKQGALLVRSETHESQSIQPGGGLTATITCSPEGAIDISQATVEQTLHHTHMTPHCDGLRLRICNRRGTSHSPAPPRPLLPSSHPPPSLPPPEAPALQCLPETNESQPRPPGRARGFVAHITQPTGYPTTPQPAHVAPTCARYLRLCIWSMGMLVSISRFGASGMSSCLRSLPVRLSPMPWYSRQYIN